MVVNLDPANSILEFDPAINITDLVKIYIKKLILLDSTLYFYCNEIVLNYNNTKKYLIFRSMWKMLCDCYHLDRTER